MAAVVDAATGNVVDSAGNVIGALNPLTGQVLDSAGNLVGTVGQVLDDVTDTVTQLNTGDLLKGDLLNVDVNVDLDADLAAPINGAVAANANVAAPIDAAVAASILSEDSVATAVAQQDAIINQSITGTAEATSEQTSDIDQSSIEPPDTDTASADDSAAEETPTIAARRTPLRLVTWPQRGRARRPPRSEHHGRRARARRRTAALGFDGGLRLPGATGLGPPWRRAGPATHASALRGAGRHRWATRAAARSQSVSPTSPSEGCRPRWSRPWSSRPGLRPLGLLGLGRRVRAPSEAVRSAPGPATEGQHH